MSSQVDRSIIKSCLLKVSENCVYIHNGSNRPVCWNRKTMKKKEKEKKPDLGPFATALGVPSLGCEAAVEALASTNWDRNRASAGPVNGNWSNWSVCFEGTGTGLLGRFRAWDSNSH